MCLNNSKEAQKCYCEALNCRGWIGETPEEEKEKIEKKEKLEIDTKKKKEEKKPVDYMEDEDVNTIAQLITLYELAQFVKQFLYYFIILYFILVGGRNRQVVLKWFEKSSTYINVK